MNTYGSGQQYNRGFDRRNNHRQYDRHEPREDPLKWIPDNLVNISSEKFKTLMKSDGDIEKFVKNNLNKNELRRQRQPELKSTQLRKFFDEIKKIEKEVKNQNISDLDTKLILLEPSIKYARSRDLCPDVFVNLMVQLIEKVTESKEEDKSKAFKTFVQIFEAVVAYNKYNND